MKDIITCISINDWPKTRLIRLKNVETQEISMTVDVKGKSPFFKKGKKYTVEFTEVK